MSLANRIADNHKLRLGVAGLGIVGSGLLAALQEGGPRFEGRFEIVGVSARDRERARVVDISRFAWFDDPVALASHPDVDVFIELIGGSAHPAKTAIEAALQLGKSVVSANKALLAEHGHALLALAQQNGANLAFEAAVAGGIPVISALRLGLAGARVDQVSAILNGTSNFILSVMEAQSLDFAAALALAQAKGFAEADPRMDVSGADARHKLAILCGLTLHCLPDPRAIRMAGIERVTPLDIASARRLGFRIKPLARLERRGEGFQANVGPALLPLHHPLAHIDGALNAVLVDASPIGRLTFSGPGAGAGPTASAVMADLIDLLDGPGRAPFGIPARQLTRKAPMAQEAPGRHYLRVQVVDRPGTLAAVSHELGAMGVSIDSFHQDAFSAHRAAVPIFLTTQPCEPEALDAAIAAIARLASTLEPPLCLPIAMTIPPYPEES